MASSLSKTRLAALLRERGFRGSAPTFRRLVGRDSVHVVNLQASRGGGVFVNLGTHFVYLGKVDREKIREYECAFRTRLKDIAGGERFFLDDESSVAALLEMMRVEGFLWFSQFEPEQLGRTIQHVALAGPQSFAPLGAGAPIDTWIAVARRQGDRGSERRLLAQAGQR